MEEVEIILQKNTSPWKLGRKNCFHMGVKQNPWKLGVSNYFHGNKTKVNNYFHGSKNTSLEVKTLPWKFFLLLPWKYFHFHGSRRKPFAVGGNRSFHQLPSTEAFTSVFGRSFPRLPCTSAHFGEFPKLPLTSKRVHPLPISSIMFHRLASIY